MILIKNDPKKWSNNKKNKLVPSGMSAAMTTTSANSHKQYFTNNGYLILHTSKRCFPVKLNNND